MTFVLVNCIEAEDSGLLGCDTVSLESCFQSFRRMCFRFQESGSPRNIVNLMDYLTLEDEGTMVTLRML